MGRGRLEVLVDNAWRTHVGRRGGEECYDTHRSVLYRDPRAYAYGIKQFDFFRARDNGQTIDARCSPMHDGRYFSYSQYNKS